jgi:hypothetical protein
MDLTEDDQPQNEPGEDGIHLSEIDGQTPAHDGTPFLKMVDIFILYYFASKRKGRMQLEPEQELWYGYREDKAR